MAARLDSLTPMTERPATSRPIKLTIAALGGQGGGVLANWLVEIAEAQGYLAQSTSVPGVAQRTGATIYYLEFFPRAEAEHVGREPIMALMPAPGDVDCVVASELAEAGRAIQRGLVSRDRTTLIASSHRSYAISEKSALGHAAVDSAGLIDLLRNQAKRLILFDMEVTAERHASVISSVLLGAVCGSGALPFRKEAFEAAISRSGIAVNTNLAAFEDAYRSAERGDSVTADRGEAPTAAKVVPTQSRSPELQPLLDRVHRFPERLQALVLEGVRRALDYQDPAYAALYLERLERIGALDAKQLEGGSLALTAAAARGLALWMSFEDTIRVADLKTRSTRFARVRDEVRAEPDQLVGITEFMKPRVAEIAGTLPASLGRRLRAAPRLCRALARWTGGKQIRTTTVSGFLFLHALAGLRRWRRATLRYQEENARIEQWLERMARLAPCNYALATELAKAQRLIKGYGETHERGWRNFTTLLAQLDRLEARADGGAILARLQEAALTDEEGRALATELTRIPTASAARPEEAEPVAGV